MSTAFLCHLYRVCPCCVDELIGTQFGVQEILPSAEARGLTQATSLCLPVHWFPSLSDCTSPRAWVEQGPVTVRPGCDRSSLGHCGQLGSGSEERRSLSLCVSVSHLFF